MGKRGNELIKSVVLSNGRTSSSCFAQENEWVSSKKQGIQELPMFS